MVAYITTCFADWQSETFHRGIMAMRDGRRTDDQIRRALRDDETEDTHWYRKADPDFERMTYSRCHRQLRQVLRIGDTLFFRTLWQGQPYLIGYFTVIGIQWPQDNPIILASRERSRLIDFHLPVTRELVWLLNPRSRERKRTGDFSHWVNARLGRNYLRLDAPPAAYLKTLIDSLAASTP